MKKKILSILLSAILLFGCAAAGAEPVSAAVGSGQPPEQYPSGGLMPFEMKELPEEAITEDAYALQPEADGKAGSMAGPKSAVYSHDWDKYSTYYFYNQMTDNERAFYDKLYEVCREYLSTEKAVKSFINRGERCYYTGLIETGGLTDENASRIMNIFRFSNPQYYFLNSVGWYGTDAVGIGIYKAFSYGTQRTIATRKVKQQMDAWGKEVARGSTDFEKAKIAHDLIDKKVSYNHDYYGNLDEEAAFSQSAYSAVCMDKTVCAGYSQAYEMLCNSVGIDTIAVTSLVHEWNKIRLNDSWYNVDCTWDDSDGDAGGSQVFYRFFARNDEEFDKADRENPANYDTHRAESWWQEMLPACSLDSGSTMKAPGILPQITRKAAEPVISYNPETRTAVLSCETKNAVIYYSVDGTDPSPASVKCRKYTGKAFTADGTFQIKAAAAADAHLDSNSAQTGKMEIPPLVRIRFSGNGSTSGSMQAITYDPLKNGRIPDNRFKRTGYTFGGWNTKANGKGTSYANRQIIKKISGRTVTLYAQWKPIRYTIKYNLNGGKNSSKNPSYYYTTKTVRLQKAVRSGYTFKGWYADKNYKKKITSIKKGSTGNRTLYAKWQKQR